MFHYIKKTNTTKNTIRIFWEKPKNLKSVWKSTKKKENEKIITKKEIYIQMQWIRKWKSIPFHHQRACMIWRGLQFVENLVDNYACNWSLTQNLHTFLCSCCLWEKTLEVSNVFFREEEEEKVNIKRANMKNRGQVGNLREKDWYFGPFLWERERLITFICATVDTLKCKKPINHYYYFIQT